LIAEGDPSTRALLRRLAEERGFGVVEATDGEEAVRDSRGCMPDLIFLDLELARLNGLAALSRIRDHDASVPVVMVTSDPTAEVTERALTLGAVNLIGKPFDEREVQFVLEQIYKTIGVQADIHDVLGMLDRRVTKLSFVGATGVLSKVVAYLGRELEVGYPGYEIPITEIKLALYEALANAYEHGNLEIGFSEKSTALQSAGGIGALVAQRRRDARLAARRIQLEVDYERHRAIYRIRDEGRGFDHLAQVSRPIAAATALHGRGITLIRHYMDEMSWNESGNELRLVKNLRVKGQSSEGQSSESRSEE